LDLNPRKSFPWETVCPTAAVKKKRASRCTSPRPPPFRSLLEKRWQFLCCRGYFIKSPSLAKEHAAGSGKIFLRYHSSSKASVLFDSVVQQFSIPIKVKPHSNVCHECFS